MTHRINVNVKSEEYGDRESGQGKNESQCSRGLNA